MEFRQVCDDTTTVEVESDGFYVTENGDLVIYRWRHTGDHGTDDKITLSSVSCGNWRNAEVVEEELEIA